MTLEEIFNDLAKGTGITPRTIRKPENPTKRRAIIPTMWDRFGMICLLEYCKFNENDEEFIVHWYKAGEEPEKRYVMTLWLANISCSPAFEGQDTTKTIVEYHLEEEVRLREVSINFLGRAEQYAEVRNLLQREAKRKIEYRTQFDESQVRDFVYRLCNPQYLN